ncbi:MAG: F0F1 ATP synthase subunit B [Candidatus Omnitrophota bacterium]
MELLQSEIVAQIISFLILLVLLRIFAWGKILTMIDERKARIAAEFKRIEDTKAEVAKVKADLDAQLAAIDETRRHQIQEAIAEARRITDEIRKKANENAEDIIKNAKENIRHELANAKEELKERVIELTISATENLISEKLTREEDRRLVRDFLTKLDEAR